MQPIISCSFHFLSFFPPWWLARNILAGVDALEAVGSLADAFAQAPLDNGVDWVWVARQWQPPCQPLKVHQMRHEASGASSNVIEAADHAEGPLRLLSHEQEREKPKING